MARKKITIKKFLANIKLFFTKIIQAAQKKLPKKNIQPSKSTHPRFLSLSMNEQTFFAKRLAFLIKANIPMLDSLYMIREQTISKRYARVLDMVIDDVSNGQSLSTSLGKFSRIFGDFSINIIHIGETTGVLSENLEYLADEMKKKQALRKKIIGAFVYPVVVTLATLGITLFLMVYLFPKIVPVFNSLHAELPLSTRMVIVISNTLREHGLLIFLVLAVFISILYFLIKKNESIQFQYDRIILRLPAIGKMIQYYNLANLSRTFGLLLKSGITLSEAIPIVARTATNSVYKKECDAFLKIVNRGEKLSVYLKKNRSLFPDMVGQIVSVGERSGNLPNSFMYLSDLYESEVEDFTKNLSNVIEPALMIFMGVLVGFIAISIITPIYSITQNLHA